MKGLRAAPILPSRNLAATESFYAKLGFEAQGLWPDEYLIVCREPYELHFFLSPSTDAGSNHAGCFLRVSDAPAMFDEFAALDLLPRGTRGIPRLHGEVETTDYRMLEFAIVDPDGNLLRIGSATS